MLLEDILPLVPTRCLKTGLHDPELPLRFHVDELSSGIARGRVAVPVSRLAQICPQVFEPPSTVVEDVAIRLPLQKLIEQLGFVEVGPRRSVAPSPKPMPATVAPAHIWVSARPEIVALRSSEFVPLPRPEAADAINGSAIDSVPVPPAHSNGVCDHGEPFSSHEPAAPAPADPSVEDPAFEKAPEPAALPVMAEGGASIQVTPPVAPVVFPVSRAGSLSDADSKPDLQPEPAGPAESSSVSGENGAEVPVTALAETCVAHAASEVEVAVPVDVTVPRGSRGAGGSAVLIRAARSQWDRRLGCFRNASAVGGRFCRLPKRRRILHRLRCPPCSRALSPAPADETPNFSRERSRWELTASRSV